MRRPDFVRHMTAFLLLSMVVTAVGCSNEKPTGTLSGAVTYNGSPVNAGAINFISADGAGAESPIEGGEYAVEGALPVGQYSVFLSPPRPQPQPPGKPPIPAAKFDVPAKFHSSASSGLKVTVEAGKNDLPVEIKD